MTHLLASAVLAVGVGAAAVPTQRLPIEPLLDSYQRGDYTAVTQQLEAVEDVRVLDRLDDDLRNRARRWIEAAEPSEQRRRGFIAGLVAAELTHVLAERSTRDNDRSDNHALRPTALPEISHYLSDRIGTSPDALDRMWTLICLATWQDWAITTISQYDNNFVGWGLLLGEWKLVGARAVPDIMRNGGFLAEARRRFPSEGRLALAFAEAREALETRCAATFCHDEMTPATLEDLQERTRTAPPNIARFPDSLIRRIYDTANVNLAAFERLAPTAAAFAAVGAAHPDVREEANVHIGYLAIRAARPDAALAPLATAATSEDLYVRYLAEHLTGRALEALGRRIEAIAAYRRALALVPHAPVTTTLLASQLFLSDAAAEREEAHAVLRASMLAMPRPDDPWRLYWYGDARLYPTYIAQLRAELRQ